MTNRHRRYRKQAGFWAGLRHQSHTDHLRYRLGGATGRALVRGINRHRARRGLQPIPSRSGDDWFTFTRPRTGSRAGHLSATRTVRIQIAGPRPPARRNPAPGPAHNNWASPGVKTTPVTARNAAFRGPSVAVGQGSAKTRKVPLGSVSVASAGVRGPGNSGNAAGPGQYGTGGASGSGGIGGMGASGQAGAFSASSPASTLNPAGGPATTRIRGGHKSARGAPSQPAPSAPAPIPAPASTGTEGSTMGSTAGFDALSEAPETDAEYVAALRGLSGDVRGFAERLEGYQATLLEVVGMDQAALRSYTAASEHMSEAATAIEGAVRDFLSTYQGVLETAASGVKIPGGEGRFFTGEAVA